VDASIPWSNVLYADCRCRVSGDNGGMDKGKEVVDVNWQ
jgi:hypothetical protein